MLKAFSYLKFYIHFQPKIKIVSGNVFLIYLLVLLLLRDEDHFRYFGHVYRPESLLKKQTLMEIILKKTWKCLKRISRKSPFFKLKWKLVYYFSFQSIGSSINIHFIRQFVLKTNSLVQGKLSAELFNGNETIFFVKNFFHSTNSFLYPII